MANLITVQQVAVLLALDVRRIQQLVAEGLPKEARGKYDAMKCLVWHNRYLQKKLAQRTDKHGDPTTVHTARLRTMTAEAELKEIELARERGKVVAVEDVARELQHLVLDVKARILAVAPRLAADLVGQQDSRVMIQAKVEKALSEALLQLAKYERQPDPIPATT